MLLEKKKRLDLALESLEKLLETSCVNADATSKRELEQINASLIEENKLAKDTILAQTQELERWKEKNRLAIEAVQDIIKTIETQEGK